MYGSEIIGELTSTAKTTGLPHTIRRDGDGYTAEIHLPLRDGRVLVCRGHCSLREAAAGLGYDDDDLDEIAGLAESESDDLEEVGSIFGDAFRAVKSVAKGAAKGIVGIGQAVKKAAKSKAFRAAIGTVAKLARNPIVIGALGAVTAGAALPALAAAGAATNLIDMATKAGNTPAGKAARKLVRVAAHVADHRGDPRRPMHARGSFAGTRINVAQARQIKALATQVRAGLPSPAERRLAAVATTAAKRRAVMAPAAARAAATAPRVPAPVKSRDVLRYMVELSRVA